MSELLKNGWSAWGLFGFAEVEWTQKLKSSIGYSILTIESSDLQSADAFRRGQYALINLRCYPFNDAMIGIEYQYGRMDNFSDGFFPPRIKSNFNSNSIFQTWEKISKQ
jgi:hypothetical protein